MSGLPKIVIARLKANPDAPKSAVDPGGLAGFQGAEHPDANLLAAFAERTLTEKERTQVLNHLSQCADCRTVAAFALPGEVAAAEPAGATATRRPFPWRLLRWGAMAAILGMLTLVVVLHPGMWNRPTEIAQKAATPPAPASEMTSVRPSAPPQPSAPASSAAPEDKTEVEARGSAGEMAVAQAAAQNRKDLAPNDHKERAQAKKQVTTMTASQPPPTLRAENVPGISIKREEGKAANSVTAEVAPAPPASPVPAPVAAAPSEDAAKAKSEPKAGTATIRTTNQSVAVTSAGGGGFGGGVAGGAVSAKAAPGAPAAASVRVTAQAAMVPMQVSRQAVSVNPGPPAVLWRVSANGKVERSTDGGNSFGPIHVALGVKFRAIAALGNNVWTGGTRGAMFHSADGGLTWVQIGIPFEGGTVTETIVNIQLLDAQHLTITTASGSQWVSADGGQHWHEL